MKSPGGKRRPDPVAIGPVGADEGRDGDDAGVAEELGHGADAADVLLAVLGREAQAEPLGELLAVLGRLSMAGPAFRPWRMLSPSSTKLCTPSEWSLWSTRLATVLLPQALRPVNQTTQPLCPLSCFAFLAVTACSCQWTWTWGFVSHGEKLLCLGLLSARNQMDHSPRRADAATRIGGNVARGSIIGKLPVLPISGDLGKCQDRHFLRSASSGLTQDGHRCGRYNGVADGLPARYNAMFRWVVGSRIAVLT